MGTRGREIIKVDIDKLIELLNKALSDEWLAYYQYWVGAKVIKGPLRGEAFAELTQHAADELRHAEMVSARIVQLGGIPVLNPQEWAKLTNCGYEAPTDFYIEAILKQNIKGEQCAISVYSKLAEFTKDKDMVTYNMALSIMSDEVEHEDDLEAILDDLDTERERMK